MAKQKKKRNKIYTGAGAAVTQPMVTHLTAANRNRLQQWWYERKRIVKPIAITALAIIIVIWLIVELIRAVS